MRLVAGCSFLACLVLVNGAFAGTRTVRIFDPARQVKTALTLADLVPSTARVVRDPSSGSASLEFSFTSSGRIKFCTLTRGLVLRGTRVGVPQQMAFAVDGRTYARPTIDFKLFPHGLCGTHGLQVYLKASLAQRLARVIRG